DAEFVEHPRDQAEALQRLAHGSDHGASLIPEPRIRGRGKSVYGLKLTYTPKKRLLESKSMKLYLWGFRDKGAFAEDLAATILKDLVGACDPVEMTMDLTQKACGGLQIRTVVRHKDRE
ncbi:MAG: hypothetical protein ACRDSJ_15025, partial [Rubrobacteraceae bacterium]